LKSVAGSLIRYSAAEPTGTRGSHWLGRGYFYTSRQVPPCSSNRRWPGN